MEGVGVLPHGIKVRLVPQHLPLTSQHLNVLKVTLQALEGPVEGASHHHLPVNHEELVVHHEVDRVQPFDADTPGHELQGSCRRLCGAPRNHPHSHASLQRLHQRLPELRNLKAGVADTHADCSALHQLHHAPITPCKSFTTATS